MDQNYSLLVLYFTLFSFVGWVIETLWCSIGARKFVNRGFLGGPWCPVYGFGALLLLICAEPVRRYPLAVFAVSLVSTTALEYFTGWLLEALFKMRWWDYSDRRFQIHGRVCLRNSLLFGLLGLLAVYVLQPFAQGLLQAITPQSQRVLASVLVGILFFDLFRTLTGLAKLEERLQHFRDVVAELERVQGEYEWFDRADLAGSIGRLRDVCMAHPEDAAAASILGRLDELRDRRAGARFLRAYPRLRSRAYGQEMRALRSEWALKRKLARERIRAAQQAAKDRAKGQREAVRLSYDGLTVTRLIWVFLIGSVIGFVVETAFCLLMNGVIESRQGMVYGPFNQVYGFGAVAMVLLLTPLARHGDKGLFVGGMLVGGAFEALCSWVQEIAFGSTSWDYAEQSFSFFGGRTSLLYMFFWGVLAVVYMRMIYPRMVTLIDRVPTRPKRFYTVVIVVVLVLDMGLSALAVARWSGRMAGEPAANAVSAWLDARYPDAMLEEIYPNMEFSH